jgi:trans-aconitate 2-methyltransferase
VTEARAGWDARAYTRLGEPQFRWATALIEQLELRGDETILDAGCGSGRVTAVLRDRVPRGRVIAVDASLDMLEQARATLGEDRIEYRHADLATLGMLGVADVVFSAAVFHWVPDHAALFRSLFAALVRGGRLHAQCGGVGNLDRILARADDVGRREPFRDHLVGFARTTNFATVEESERRLADAGFAEIRCWTTPAPTTFAAREVFTEFIEKVVLRDHLARLPDRAVRRAYVDAISDRAAADDPPWCLDYMRLDLRAIRH